MFLREGVIYRSHNVEKTKLMDAESILLPGLHNVENYMAAFAATDGIVSDDTCRTVAESFRGVAHRLEMIRTLYGVTYCNESLLRAGTISISRSTSSATRSAAMSRHCSLPVLRRRKFTMP